MQACNSQLTIIWITNIKGVSRKPRLHASIDLFGHRIYDLVIFFVIVNVGHWFLDRENMHACGSYSIILVLCLETLWVTGALLKLCYIKLSCKPFSVLNTFMRFLISIPASKPTGSFSKNSGTDIPSLMSFAKLWKSLISTYRENNNQKIMLEQSQRAHWSFKVF